MVDHGEIPSMDSFSHGFVIRGLFIERDCIARVQCLHYNHCASKNLFSTLRAPNLGRRRVTSPQTALKKSSKIFLKAGFHESAGESILRIWSFPPENSGARPAA